MATKADTDAEPTESEDTTEEMSSIATRVSASTWRKLKWQSLKMSMSEGKNVTISAVTAALLEQVAEQLDDPPADLVS